jgi:hypothetical protein
MKPNPPFIIYMPCLTHWRTMAVPCGGRQDVLLEPQYILRKLVCLAQKHDGIPGKQTQQGRNCIQNSAPLMGVAYEVPVLASHVTP